jgi:hypothetical protein
MGHLYCECAGLLCGDCADEAAGSRYADVADVLGDWRDYCWWNHLSLPVSAQFFGLQVCFSP